MNNKKIHENQMKTVINTDRELFSCLNNLRQNCVTEIINTDLILESISKSKELHTPIPLILTLCPAVFNLNFPTPKGQTRELVAIQPDNLRVKSLFQETFGLQIFLKESADVDTELFLIFADLLEKDSERTITNSQEINNISQLSVKSMRQIITTIDQESDGLFQRLGIKIPKVRLQSGIAQQGGKINLNREQMIRQFETSILDPNSDLFQLWSRHLKLARDDSKFTETSWQNQKSAEAIWNRMRFLIAELASDGVFLPDIIKVLNSNIQIEPIFLASSTRKATIEMESDCFNLTKRKPLIPAFRNIGKWLEPSESSPWIDRIVKV